MDSFAALNAFVATVDASGFASAGRQLGMVTSSVTRQVDALEEKLGTRLLNRSTRGVTLTTAGEAYYEHAVRLLADLESANLEASEAQGPPRGQLRVSLPVAFGQLHISPALPAFLARYPGITLELLLSDDVADLVEQRLDLAIRLGSVNSPDIVARRLAPHHRLLCASPEYLRRHGVPRTPADLAQHACLTFAYTRGNHLWHFTGRSEESVRVSGPLRANNSLVLREAALNGMGLLLIADWLVGKDIDAGRLQIVLPEWKAHVNSEDSGVYAVYLPNRRNSKKVRAFVEFFVEHFGEPPYWGRSGG
ncbi:MULTISPECIES: LysR family transcriptional regulator [unclassified Pseudomonas]|uniref:LysR family transcriptional regulator n=1 Tax=unclassified Pseudomonas TaxID=196821 RepID=UPI0021CAC863|nr:MULTISPECIES: LysR family transcriptional regulator [unclassified Pseudomonas]MCU1735048.1 LysR family transcriptional regulator [Pseudomonas sp. 20P_3.2_Bac4]MCU1743523.1 LysR family transcriptional regulator [Pseudomonas sp. 20P_3.2_Bac5]